MIARVLHAMTPDDLPVCEQELASDLPEVAAAQRPPPAGDELGKGLDDDGEEGLLDVGGRLRAHAHGVGHAEGVVQPAGRVGVDGEPARGRVGVEGDEVRVPAADDDDLRGGGEGKEAFGRDGRAEGAEVFLAVLERISGNRDGSGWDGRARTPQKKCRMNITITRRPSCSLA